jgi:lipopolysaccharide transport system ATP-binding protein
MSDPAIRLRGVGKRYKLFRRSADKLLDALGLGRLLFWHDAHAQEFWALRGLDLDVPGGERVGIIGRNGAGKSTLLKIISGVLNATEGTVEVRGSIQALMELGTAFHPDFTGRQNVHASLAYHGFSPAQIRDLEEEIVDFAEIDDFIDQPIRTYSAGMYARLAFSAATVVKPDILVIDEILGAGDAYFAGKSVERMRRLTETTGATVLFVSHDLDSVQRLCTRVVWIERGQVRGDGAPLQVIKQYSQTVRRDEELRIKARDLRIQKKHALLREGRLADLYDRMLFHLVVEGAHPRARHRVLHASLRRDGEEIGRIEMGAPLDNSADHLHYVMDSPGYMDWGPACVGQKGTYREYRDRGGRYGHAPFEFAVPKSGSAPAEYELAIAAEPDPAERVFVEWYDGKSYLRLGDLQRETRIRFRPQASLAGERPAASSDALAGAHEGADFSFSGPDAQYGDREVEIRRVALLDAAGNDRRSFETGERLRIRIDYFARRTVSEAVFVFCVYLPDGQCATQVWTSTAEIGIRELRESGAVEFIFDSLVLGQSPYVASAAVFQRLPRDGVEAPAHHVWDRCIHFEVRQAGGSHPTRGLCTQPYTAVAAP